MKVSGFGCNKSKDTLYASTAKRTRKKSKVSRVTL